MTIGTAAVLELFKEIGRLDITGEETDLLSSSTIDSMDIMSLIEAFRRKYGHEVDAMLLEEKSFESCAAIAEVLNQSLAN